MLLEEIGHKILQGFVMIRDSVFRLGLDGRSILSSRSGGGSVVVCVEEVLLDTRLSTLYRRVKGCLLSKPWI